MTVESTVTNMLGKAFWEHWDAVGEDGVGRARTWARVDYLSTDSVHLREQSIRTIRAERNLLVDIVWEIAGRFWRACLASGGAFGVCFFFTLSLTWSQGHCFFGDSSTGVDFLFGALRNQSLHSHSWPPSQSHLPETWRWSPWLLATPGFGLLETVSIAGSNRRKAETRTFIVAVVCWCCCCLKMVRIVTT